jgi:single-strand DNA-binding protein
MSDLRLPKINAITISGRLTRDVELRYTPTGTPVARLSLAFDRNYRDASGEWKQESSFIDVVVWEKRAEQCAQTLHKGSPIMIEGYLKTRSYIDKDNNNRKITEIVAQRVHFLEKTVGEVSEHSSSYKKDDYETDEELTSTTTDDDVPF